ncbi:MAG TPA: AI-2E family transporter [Xanthomonadaceae bacterium]|jgi:predicted PurR-regulated permease PerM|nr:AI-2E family transporter [Xanthomonadaceae bacterium]
MRTPEDAVEVTAQSASASAPADLRSPASVDAAIGATDAPRPRASTAMVVLATLALLFVAWAASDVLIPLLLAMFFALIGNPVIRLLKKLLIPRFVGGALVLGAGLAGAVLLIDQLAEPASVWIHQAPAELHQLEPKVRTWLRPMQEASSAAQSIAQAASSDGTKPTRVIKTEVNDPWGTFLDTPRWVASVLAVVLLTYFFMVYGEGFQRKAIAMLPSRQQKRVTSDILQAIEREISRYVVTITLINATVGTLLAGILMAIGVPMQQAMLWGTLMAILNFAPYIGPMIGVGVMLLMGFTSFKGLLPALLPAMIYLGLHVLEGEIVTPIVLGRRMAISPLILILALMAMGWLWGIAGLLLAVPMLVCVKIVLARVDTYSRWAHLLE